MIIDFLFITVGFLLLVCGGELLVRGAVDIAERLKVSAFVIGALIIGFGSSTPELVTSVEASLIGAPGIAIGNIVGSNIINILVVLGVAAVIAPIALSGRHVTADTIIVCGLTAAFVAACAALQLTPVVGAVFLIALSVYLSYTIHREMRGDGAVSDGLEAKPETGVGNLSLTVASASKRSALLVVGVVIFGFALLILGGHFVVSSAISLAKAAGASQTVIGLTVVALGTSLPEIVTAVVAAFRRHADVALGNVLGSCVFNLLAIGGIVALLSPSDVPPELIRFDNLVMLAAAISLLLAVTILRQIGRPAGLLFLGGYAAYLAVIWP